MIFVLLFLSTVWTVQSEDVPLVALFPPHYSEQELAFRLAVDKVNKDSIDLAAVRLIPNVQHVKQFDSFNMTLTVCELMRRGIGAIIGPQSLETAGILKAMSNRFNLPLIQTHWDINIEDEATSETAVNIFPDPDLLAKGVIEVIEDMDWESYTIIYENEESLIRLQGILEKHEKGVTPEGRVPFTVWQLKGDDYRPLFKEIRQSSETHIILDCSADKITKIFEQAKEVNMMDDYHTYVLTSLDAHTVDVGQAKYGRTNITTLRLVDPQRHLVQALVHDWTYTGKNHYPPKITQYNVKTESALMNDAVTLFASALNQLHKENPELVLEAESLECSEENVLGFGKRIGTIMKELELDGMTGKIKFDENGRRTFFTLDITELTSEGFRKIGSWDPEVGMSYTRSKSEMETELYQHLSNKTLIVVSKIGEPYLSIANDSLEGNDRYQGYSKDIIQEIANDLNFKFKLVLAPDNAHGSYNTETKQWNGLIKELRERRADLAICDLTITYERRSAVDFTKPFMTLGISILYSKPDKQETNLFSFLSPLSLNVWIYMATAYLGVSVLLYFLGRISPDEWKNPHPCNPDPVELENDLSMLNVLWHNCGSLMQQGSDIAPQAISSRTVAAMWWFFVLIMISSYTANLAAFLTMERMDVTIENVEDLAKQNKIKYGVMDGGASMNFFKNSNVSIYQRMWSAMESSRPTVFAKTNEEGVDRVLKGKRLYAFFMESTTIEYQMGKHCELTKVGGLLDSKGYGIAMPFNSPYRIAISGAVLNLQENGKLLEIKNKWWQGDKSKCEEKQEVSSAAELGIGNVGGVFLVLIVGTGVALLVALLEFVWNVRKVAVTEKLSPKEAFLLELKFAVNLSETTKPVRHTVTESEADDYENDDIEKQELVEKHDSSTQLDPYSEFVTEEND